jgi:hypothetical protein
VSGREKSFQKYLRVFPGPVVAFVFFDSGVHTGQYQTRSPENSENVQQEISFHKSLGD